MGLMDYFRSPPAMSAGDVRELIKKKSPEDIYIIDVRQSGEYEQGHLPGARLVPMNELGPGVESLDRDKPVITY